MKHQVKVDGLLFDALYTLVLLPGFGDALESGLVLTVSSDVKSM